MSDSSCAILNSVTLPLAQTSRMGANHSGAKAATIELPADPAAFIAKYGGVIEASYGAKHALYSQGDAADCIFYFQKGRAQIKVVSTSAPRFESRNGTIVGSLFLRGRHGAAALNSINNYRRELFGAPVQYRTASRPVAR